MGHPPRSQVSRKWPAEPDAKQSSVFSVQDWQVLAPDIVARREEWADRRTLGGLDMCARASIENGSSVSKVDTSSAKTGAATRNG